jgi:hypothetical protein
VRAPALLFLFVGLAGCIGSIRESTTPRTAREQLLCTTAAGRAVSHIDSSRFTGRRVFIDVERLAVQVDRGYVLSAFDQLVWEAGGKVAPARDKADLVIEARAAALGTYEGKWIIWVPVPSAPGFQPPEGSPKLLEIGYSLQEGWCRIDAFCYEPATGAYVCGWRASWGRAYLGFFDDIYPEATIATAVKSRVE